MYFPWDNDRMARIRVPWDCQACDGCRVVIIRPDLTGNTDLISNYMITIPHREVLPLDYTEVQIMMEGPFKDKCFFVKEDSLRWSHFEPVQWNNEYIVWMLCCLSKCFPQCIYTRWTKWHVSGYFQAFFTFHKHIHHNFFVIFYNFIWESIHKTKKLEFNSKTNW